MNERMRVSSRSGASLEKRDGKIREHLFTLIENLNELLQGAQEPKDEFQNRLLAAKGYLERCIQPKNLSKLDLDKVNDRVMTEYAQAYEAGMLTGCCGPKYIFTVEGLRLRDKDFKRLLHGLTARKSKCPEGVTLYYPGSKLTDESLEALSVALKDPKFPRKVTIDISDSPDINESGLRTLLNTLADENCNASFTIKLANPRGAMQPKTLDAIAAQLEANHERYEAAQAEKARLQSAKKAAPKKSAKIKADDAKPKAHKKGLFSAHAKPKAPKKGLLSAASKKEKKEEAAAAEHPKLLHKKK